MGASPMRRSPQRPTRTRLKPRVHGRGAHATGVAIPSGLPRVTCVVTGGVPMSESAGGGGPTVICLSCTRSYKLKPELAGKKVKCKCGAVIDVPDAAPVAALSDSSGGDTYGLAAVDDGGADLRTMAALAAGPIDEAQSVRCPYCEQPIDPGSAICVFCGSPLKPNAAPA